jgi:type II pantothenate kinase
MGLIKLLFNMDSFQEAISIAKKGNRYNIDLKVADIYDPKDKRIDPIFREFTASSFGKIEEDFDLNSVQKEDVINAIIHIIGENIGTISTLMAQNNEIDNIIYCGGFVSGNIIIRKILTILCKLKLKKAVFLKHSEFCGAVGALFGSG